MKHPLLISVVLVGACICSPLVAQQQPEPPTPNSPTLAPQPSPNEEQTSLYARAVEAYQAQDYPTTIALLQTANRIQPFNLFSYNIARAHIKLKQCDEASQAYKDAQVYPALGPPLTRDIEQGLEELKALCPGTATIVCAAPMTTQVSVDDSPPSSCANQEPITLKPGAHVAIATLDDQLDTYAFEITGMQHTQVDITLIPIPKSKSFASRTLGAPMAIMGGSALVGALVLDSTVVRSRRQAYADGSAQSVPYKELVARRQELRRARALTLTLGGMGAVSFALGSTLWLRASFDDDAAQASLTLSY
jgi:hypothetical protein